MADDFKARVDRVFGSLFQTIPSVVSSSPWTLSDDAVERREWSRDESAEERDEIPSSSCFDGLRKQRCKKFVGFGDHLSDFDDLDEDAGDEKENEGEDEDAQVLSGIGLDSTLDQEAEEDEYDKVAVGRENAGDRVYMNELNEYGPRVNFHNVLPDSLEEGRNTGRDPRANHVAARARLREDDQDAVACLSSHPTHGMTGLEKQTDDVANVKSILKRKDTVSDPKPRKRVRFDPGCNTKKEFEPHDSGTPGSFMVTAESEVGDHLVPEGSYGVPDYVRNPSKYVCYTLDWSTEDDDASNLHAFREFSKMAKPAASPPAESESTTTMLPKSVIFTLRKKAHNSVSVDNNKNKSDQDAPVPEAPRPIGMAAAEAKEAEACPMEEDQLETSTFDKSGAPHKVGRRYRSRDSSDNTVS